MNRTADLEAMMDAGVRSFKIEGRLKDTNYVKNVTAWYRQQIDMILARRTDTYVRASYGTSHLTFKPDAKRSFNRGFTNYFLYGRTDAPIHSFATPKAIGPAVGKVGRIEHRGFVFEPDRNIASPLTAGDGLCFVDADGKLQGFRVNKVEGSMAFPATMPPLKRGTRLHRNLDFAMDKALSKETAKRTLTADISLREVEGGYAIDMADESGCHVTLRFDYAHDEARSPQHDAMVRQLSKLGDTPFTVRHIDIQTNGERFIPASVLTEWRRAVCNKLLANHHTSYERDRAARPNDERLTQLLPQKLPFTANVANHKAEAFYKAHGVAQIEPAFELKEPSAHNTPLMTCRHCIRHALGWCLKNKPANAATQLALRLPDGRIFPLKFDCKNCEMQVLHPDR